MATKKRTPLGEFLAKDLEAKFQHAEACKLEDYKATKGQTCQNPSAKTFEALAVMKTALEALKKEDSNPQVINPC